jgi:tetratricopeptide (TPR) repeat protein
MVATQVLQAAQCRLAQHYLDKLRQAERATRRGRENRARWLNLMRQDWEQIKQWQAWSALWTDTEAERAHLCATFTIGTSDVLQVQLTPTEQLSWVQQSLDAARKLHDRDAERTLLYQLLMLKLTVEVLDQVDQDAHRLMEYAQAAQDDLSLGRAWYVMGTADFMRGGYDTAEDLLTRSLELLQACGAVEEVPIVWRGLGRVAQYRGDSRQAHTCFVQYLNAAAAVKNEQAVLNAHVALSGILLALRDYQAAAHHAQQAVVMARAFGMSRVLPPAMLSLAHAEKWLGEYDSACSHYQEAIAAARSHGSPSSVSNGLYGLGQARFFQGHPTAALPHLEEAMAIAQEARLPLRICEISHDLVLARIACNELDSARIQLREALSSARQLGTPHFWAKSLAAAITLWHHWGRHEQAAVWAGLLTHYTQNLHPTLFDATVYEQLEKALGTERYQQAVRRGKSLPLDATLSEILSAL